MPKICSLSKNLRFDELRKVLESYGFQMNVKEVAAVMLYFSNRGTCQLRYQSMNQ